MHAGRRKEGSLSLRLLLEGSVASDARSKSASGWVFGFWTKG